MARTIAGARMAKKRKAKKDQGETGQDKKDQGETQAHDEDEQT
jgi:hypothetical protein